MILLREAFPLPMSLHFPPFDVGRNIINNSSVLEDSKRKFTPVVSASNSP